LARRRRATSGGDFLRSGFTPANRRRRPGGGAAPWPAAVRAGPGAGGGGKAGARARVRLIMGRSAGVQGGRDTDAEAYGRRTPAESRPGVEQLGLDRLRGGLVAGPAGWSGPI
jgi:hypothetical protein